MDVEKAVLLILVSFLGDTVHSMCPSQCSCNIDIRIVDCRETQMKGVPIFLNPATETVDLSQNSLKKLENGLDFYHELKLLNISRNEFQSLGRNQFMNQINLIVLDISQNLISKLRVGAFNGLESLQRLDLSSNLMERLDKEVFTGLVNLRKLDLSNNKLSLVEKEAFRYLKKLEELNMRKNQLQIVTDWTLPLPGLTILNLSQNLIANLSSDPLPLPYLQSLDVSDNLLSEVSMRTFSTCSDLETLNVAYNNLEVVPIIPSLQQLVISGNRMVQFDQTTFSGMPSLEILEADSIFSLQQIHPLSFIDCTKLSQLSLSGNRKLQPLPSSLFQTTPHLLHLDLSHNSWHYLSRDQLPLHLLQLDLTGLPLTCNCSLLWLWQLSQEKGDIVQGAVCDGDKSLNDVSVDLLACSHQNNQLILGITVGVIALIFTLFIVIVVVKCVQSRRGEKSSCDYLHYDPQYLHYDPQQSPQMYSSYLKDNSGHLFVNDQFNIPNSKLIPSPNSPHNSHPNSQLPVEDYLSYKDTNHHEPVYYSVQDSHSVVGDQYIESDHCGQDGHSRDNCSTGAGLTLAGSNVPVTRPNLECCVPRNKTAISPSLTFRQEGFYDYDSTTRNKSLVRHKFPDVLPTTMNQNQNYYV